MKITVVTGTRAEFGLLEPLMQKIKKSVVLDISVVATGAHLLESFGSTLTDVLAAGFTVDATVHELTSAGTGGEVARQVGSGISSFASVLSSSAPDAVLLLGDRYEIFAAAVAAFFLGIPIVHLHGGEVTSGAFDDGLRHSISQLARLHAVAAPEYRQRLIRAGAEPDSVHVVGGFGVDSISKLPLLSREDLESELGAKLCDPILLVTYHPVTAASHDTNAEIAALVRALHAFPAATVIFTFPNADPEHETIIDFLKRVVDATRGWHIFAALGQQKYISLMALSAAVVGNSSSGLTEAPAIGIPTVNIGPRQEGRLAADSVISCGASSEEISAAVSQALSAEFLASVTNSTGPYGTPGAADKVLQLLESTQFDTLGPRKYWDPPSTRRS